MTRENKKKSLFFCALPSAIISLNQNDIEAINEINANAKKFSEL